MKSALLPAFGAALAVVALVAPASAESDAGERAIALGREGLELYTAQRWSECAERFAQAEALTHSPVFRLYTGRCLRGAGRLLAAREELRAVAAESLDESAPAPWRRAKADATAELALVDRAIPSVRIAIEGAASPTQKVLVGGVETQAGTAIELDPGRHEASAEGAGGAVARQVFQLAEGQKESLVTLRFGEAAAATPSEPATDPSAQPPAVAPAAPSSTPDTSSGGLVPGLVLVGTGGVALAVGAVLGVLASSGYDELREQGCGTLQGSLSCEGSAASAAQQSDFDAANSLADASTGLFIAGGVTAAVGLVVLLAFPGESAPVSARGGSLVWRF